MDLTSIYIEIDKFWYKNISESGYLKMTIY
jgi:hypothetical protein